MLPILLFKANKRMDCKASSGAENIPVCGRNHYKVNYNKGESLAIKSAKNCPILPKNIASAPMAAKHELISKRKLKEEKACEANNKRCLFSLKKTDKKSDELTPNPTIKTSGDQSKKRSCRERKEREK